ncbi:MAG TPA: GH3 auxin-responsive promoter family protein, partial [Anditalea sp.]|nr:GH3 auxin-responsive promoter family protein [Anditalea sp.]
EFQTPPEDHEQFVTQLDQSLRDINSDYDAKRYKDLALVRPKVHFAENGLFERWLKSKGKLGGQNKVPRLSNNREYIDELLGLM